MKARVVGLLGTLGLAGGATAGVLAITAPGWAGRLGWGAAMVGGIALALWAVQRLRQRRWSRLIRDE
ncbi:hypothetical protein DXV76_13565 [Rhodobacteraceae bacterium CCMM004]|nr:hypothetical protein DXV76_13565 [Rhodobacteraceae bacterium CCMM004]